MMADNLTKMQEFWKDYATAFAHPLTSNGILGKFVRNQNVTGAYAEVWVKSLTRSMLHNYRISTGTIIRISDRMSKQPNPQCDMIIWSPAELPALFEKDDFALVPIHSARAIIEVKRTCDHIADFQQQLQERQKALFYEYRKYVLGVVVSHKTPLFQYSVEENWVNHLDSKSQPAITRLLDKKTNQVDPNGVFAFIFFLSQVAWLDKAPNKGRA
jgi:hypothetical protein